MTKTVGSFEEIQRAKEIMTASRTRAIELAHQGKAEESRQLQQEAVIPDYEKYLNAIDLTVDYKAKLGQSTADAGKASALFSVRLIARCPRPRLTSDDRSGMAGHPLDQPRPQRHNRQP